MGDWMRNLQKGYWSESEIATLRLQLSSGADLTEIARKLRRTRESVYQKAVKEGIIVPRARPTPRSTSKSYSKLFGD